LIKEDNEEHTAESLKIAKEIKNKKPKSALRIALMSK